MLVLTIRSGSGFFLGDDTRVRVLSIQGDKVRVGVEAPPEVKVLREDLVPPGVKPSEAVPGRAG